MDVDIIFTTPWGYSFKDLKSWLFLYGKYKYIKGFKLRVVGFYINVREKNATEKLIAMAKAKQKPS